MNSLGRHILAEYIGCEPGILNDVTRIEAILLEAAEEAEATVVNSTFHHFSPFGVSGVVVIAESHFAIHTWPEYGFAAVDLFTCGETVDPGIAQSYLEKALQAQSCESKEITRGNKEILPKTGFQLTESISSGLDKGILSNRNIWFTVRDELLAFSGGFDSGGIELGAINHPREVFDSPPPFVHHPS